MLLPITIGKKKVQTYDVISKAAELIGRTPHEIRQMYFEEKKYISIGPLEEHEYIKIEKYMEANDDWTYKNILRMEDYQKMLPSSVMSTATMR